MNVSTDKLEFAQRTAAGWQVLSQGSVQGGIKDNSWYNLMLLVNELRPMHALHCGPGPVPGPSRHGGVIGRIGSPRCGNMQNRQ